MKSPSDKGKQDEQGSDAAIAERASRREPMTGRVWTNVDKFYEASPDFQGVLNTGEKFYSLALWGPFQTKHGDKSYFNIKARELHNGPPPSSGDVYHAMPDSVLELLGGSYDKP